ncbi:protein MANNAN SYNTHESIS-RELATED 1-like [Bidens hawaiensis]|uniref:protein MANNAN SYNTHESIS-RELATED 1-like n=1 Tax=Bidens hawaiensis TaxID=980011 RepID=UPI00404B8B7D
MDIREIMGGILTLSMFLMLGNMIKRDHFDGDVLMNVPATAYVEPDAMSIIKHNVDRDAQIIEEPIKLCKVTSVVLVMNYDLVTRFVISAGRVLSKGFVTFSLTDGPEYHISQVANAVLVAKHLGATLVLPDIIGSKGEKRGFEEIYDAERFISSMSGVVQVERRKYSNAFKKVVSVKIPYNANQEYIITNVKHLFKVALTVRVITDFPPLAMREGKVDKNMNPSSCWAIFKALRLKPELQDLMNSIVKRLKNHGQDHTLTAIDYKGEMMGTGICGTNAVKGMKHCYNPVDIAQFLQRVGYPRDSPIYVTQSKPGYSLRSLKDLYPNLLTKEDVMEEAEKVKFLNSGLEQEMIDFYICSVSDVFIPAKSGLFYTNVVGNRIFNGKREVYVPAQTTSSLAEDHVSSYISQRNHPVYTCFCQ